MKNIALKEKTFELLKHVKEQENIRSFDSLVLNLIVEAKKMPKSMFGSLKDKAKPFKTRERQEMWKDLKRELHIE